MEFLWILVPVVLVALGWGASIFSRNRRRQWRSAIADAIADFHLRREHLEAQFLELGACRGQPAGWSWQDGEFEDDFVLASKRGSSGLRALVKATIYLEKVVYSPDQEGDSQTRIRMATAVFVRNGDRWTTEGRTIFDLDPEETMEQLSHELQRVT